MIDAGNRYKVLEKLGEGGMGSVWLVEDATRGRQVALKALAGQAGMDEATFLGFKQEFRTMAKLRHPNTCEVFDYGRLPDGTPYYTMEVVPGTGLDERPVSQAELPSILRQLGLALGYIHQQGFVHCDVKPENIRIKPDGTVKLMDFGLIELAGQTPTAIKGTIAYLAPEMVKLDRLDQRADLYGLGAVTYHLLTGRPPFEGSNPVEVLRAHLSQPPRPLRELTPDVSPLFERVVLKLLAKEPASRYASAYDMLAALGLEVDEGMGASLLASAFVGRGGELAKLIDALNAVDKGQGQTVWVTGPAGAGKSRLLTEFRFAVQLEELPFLQGTCADDPAPYGAFLDILRGLLPLAREACPQVLLEHTPLLSKLMPELADGRPAPSMEPKEEKTALQAAFTHLILQATAAKGGVVALDNWDQADALSVETLNYLARNAADKPLLIVCAARTAKVPGLPLLPLDAMATGEMIRSMLGVDDLPAGLVAQAHELTGGNPQLIGNLLEHLQRVGSLGRSRGRWQLPEAIAPEDLPGDIQDLLLDRLASLSPEALRVCELAAVNGQPIGVAMASAILGMEDDTLFDALDEAAQARVLEAGERGYMFGDAALRAAVYDRIPVETRLRLHRELAVQLETRMGEQGTSLGDLTLLARHFLAASPDGASDLAGRAIRYALDAGGKNLDIFALDLAQDLLTAGLALVDGRKVAEVWEETRCDYLNLLATVAHWRYDLEKANQYLSAGIPLAEKLGDKARLLEMVVTQAKNGSLSGTGARISEAIKGFERAIELADELGNARTAARARVNMGRCLFFQGSFTRAREVFSVAAERAKAADLTSWYASSLCFLGYLEVAAGGSTREQGFGHITEAIELQERIGDKGGVEYSYNLLFEVQLQAGKLKDAQESARRNTALAKELGIQDDYVIGVLNQSIVALELGNLWRALDLAGQCATLAKELDHKQALPIGGAVLALVLLHRGDYAKGVEQLRAAEQLARETSNYVYSIVLPFVVEGWLLLGEIQEALNAAQEGLFMLRSMDDTGAHVRLSTYLAEIHSRMGQSDVARDFADRAIQAAIDADAKGSLARGLFAKAMLLRKDQPDEARKAADQAAGVCSVIGADLLSCRTALVQGELAAAGGYPEATGFYQAALTLAEQAGEPQFRALALFGLSQVTAGEGASTMLLDAQKTLRGLGDELEPEARARFLAQPDLQRVMEKIPGITTESPLASPEASQLTLERLQRVSLDLQNVAGQYGVLFKEWTAKSQQLEMLNDLARQINETLQIDAVLDQVVRLTLEITKAERGFVLLRDEEEPDKLICRAAFNQFGRAIAHERSSMSVSQKVLATGQALAIMDATTNEEFQSSKSIMALNLRTLMCVPLQAKGKSLGVLYVDSQAVVTTFSDKDLDLLKAIASHASVAIENATLYSTLNQRAAELERALEMYRKADYEASTDALTGLRNRRFFLDQAARELDISRRYKRAMSLLLVDVDHFKRINDTYGHAVGDRVLVAVADALAKAARTCDLPARYGGEEFVVLCPDTDAPGAMILAERFRKALASIEVVDVEGRPIRGVTATLGVSGLAAGDKDAAAILGRADAALYHGKATGRDRVVAWSEELSGEEASPKA
ncbi:MAG: serine/threonine protein kinase [Cyanobacteria bacterium RYN_339]|nr:serine/threonine protein kinase [Cyanobacteria bacterium RYN_339]